MELTTEEKKLLLQIARLTIENYLGSGQVPQIDTDKHPILKQQSGAFVTLHKSGNLRGCIGYIISDDYLYETIHNAAIQAAFHDPRFPAVKKHELQNIEIEISILSRPFKMNSYDDIVIGEHGLIVTEYGRRGLLLPQVPIEHNMDKWEYLSSLCVKAGLPENLWQQKTLNIEMFTATVFSESELEVKDER
jgi:AmmeMemoRadiSam system protein A